MEISDHNAPGTSHAAHTPDNMLVEYAATEEIRGPPAWQNTQLEHLLLCLNMPWGEHEVKKSRQHEYIVREANDKFSKIRERGDTQEAATEELCGKVREIKAAQNAEGDHNCRREGELQGLHTTTIRLSADLKVMDTRNQAFKQPVDELLGANVYLKAQIAALHEYLGQLRDSQLKLERENANLKAEVAAFSDKAKV